MKGLELARNDLIWIAETDDSAHPDFQVRLAPYLARCEVAGAFGHIRCVDDCGAILQDLDGYFDNLLNFSWDRARLSPAYQAFRRDFGVRNVVPNASGFVFRKPRAVRARTRAAAAVPLRRRLVFHALLLGGRFLAYEPRAKSYLRLSRSGTSRSVRSPIRHSRRAQDGGCRISSSEYKVGDVAIRAHVETLLTHFPIGQGGDLLARLAPARTDEPPLRVCIAAHSLEVGGGEILPLEIRQCAEGA